MKKLKILSMGSIFFYGALVVLSGVSAQTYSINRQPVTPVTILQQQEKSIDIRPRHSEGSTVRKIGQRESDDPLTYDFKLEIDGVIRAEFREISGIESETEVVEYKDGDDMTLRKMPGRVKVNHLVLKRGFIVDPKLREWYEKVVKGITERKSASIIVLDRAGQEVKRYNLSGALPVRWEDSTSDSKGDTHTVEEVEIAYERGEVTRVIESPVERLYSTTGQPTPGGEAVRSDRSSTAIPVCFIPNELTKKYNQKILELREAEKDGKRELVEVLIKEIDSLRKEGGRLKAECAKDPIMLQHSKSCQPRPACLDEGPRCLLSEPTEGWCPKGVKPPKGVTAEVISPKEPSRVLVDRCADSHQWEEKRAFYQKLINVNDEELKKEIDFSREEVEKIIEELEEGLKKVRKQCDEQKAFKLQSGFIDSSQKFQKMIDEPVRPVAVGSGREIEEYFRAKIETIIQKDEDRAKQIDHLKALRDEIDELIVRFIKGNREIDFSELDNVVKEIKVIPGEIKIDGVIVKTINKKILANIGDRPVGIALTDRYVEIMEIKSPQNIPLKVRASEVSIKDKTLRLGHSEIRVAPSEVAANLHILPVAAELKGKNGRPVYELKVGEPRKLFGLIPIVVVKTMTFDAGSTGELLDERLPWWSFLMPLPQSDLT